MRILVKGIEILRRVNHTKSIAQTFSSPLIKGLSVNQKGKGKAARHHLPCIKKYLLFVNWP
jgi:hypothetical protein